MKLVKFDSAIQRNNSEICVVTEYPTDHPHLDFAIVHITGKYPEKGSAMNTISTEIVFVQAGEGHVIVNGSKQPLKQGDVILIEPNEQFIWEGDLKLHIACHPAFSPEQHVILD